MPGTRTYAAGRFALVLDGVACGFLQSVAGGAVAGEVITVRGPAGSFDEKHLGGVRYEELELQLDLSLDNLVYDWISASLKGSVNRRNGSIVAIGPTGSPVSEREFSHGLVTEVTIPTLDAASKDPAYLMVKIAPEVTRLKKGFAAVVKSPTARQKPWLPANFKLEIDGLVTTQVSKVDALTVKQSVTRDDVGARRDVLKELGRLEFPNLRVTLSEKGSETWAAWFDDFVVKGNNDSAKERNGRLTFLAADLKTPLGAVSFFNLGIFRLEPEPQQAGAETIARLVADLYCERMELSVPWPRNASTSASVGGAAPAQAH